MDAGENGFGAALIQSGHPIAFTSKTVTDVKTQYAYIEQECLSVYFSLEKFHNTLIAGISSYKMTINCWERIQQKPIHAAPSQLQCMLLCMQMYDYTIQYKPSKEVVLADHLGHFPTCNESLPIPIHQNI